MHTMHSIFDMILLRGFIFKLIGESALMCSLSTIEILESRQNWEASSVLSI